MGGRLKSNAQMEALRDTLDECELRSMYASGEFFTWAGKIAPNSMVFERLDRFVNSEGWRHLYPAASASNLEFYHSDHRPVEVVTGPDQSARGFGVKNKTFKFEACWLMEDEIEDIVERGWLSAPSSSPLYEKIAICCEYLKVWAGSRFRSLSKQLADKRKRLNSLKNHHQWSSSLAQIHELEKTIEKLEAQEESYWRQRSRNLWLSSGDRNTKFFHSQANKRRSQNVIKGLLSSHGDLCSDSRGMAEIILKYFSSLFSSDHPSDRDFSKVLEKVQQKVDDNMNAYLTLPFTAEEVKKAVFDLGPERAPGPDGMPGLFFQKFWKIVGGDVSRAVLAVLNEGAPLEEWNRTMITLLPKNKNPLTLKEYRPISLCNFCYKIVSRAIANRMRRVLPNIIDDFQSAFVPGRLISDNIIVGFECMHWIRSQKRSKRGFAALKLDMSKAYDRVEWNFLKAIMLKMGFHHSWVWKILQCVQTVSFSFCVNQEVFGNLKPQRGIRQGDPLSPYLFVICAQGLSSMLASLEAEKAIHGVRVASGGPSVSHLFFADDSLVFFRAEISEAEALLGALKSYEKASGQLINFDKSSLSFSPNTKPEIIDRIKSLLTIPVTQCHEEICAIPLPHQNEEDTRYWKFNSKGVYSVRDGYKLAIGAFDTLENQSAQGLHKWWKGLWGIKVPPKIKIFWWRVAKDCIHSGVNLRAHHLPISGMCSLCNFHADTTLHSLFFCPIMKPLWKHQPFAALLKKAKYASTLDMCLWMFENQSIDEFEYFATFTWFLWKERQRVIHENPKGHKSIKVEGVEAFLSNFQRANVCAGQVCKDSGVSSTAKWSPPPLGKSRLEVDACVNELRGRFGVGGIVRNAENKPILAFGKVVETPRSVLECELQAIWEGLEVCQNLNIHPAEIVSDSFLAVQAVTGEGEFQNYIKVWVSRIQKQIRNEAELRLFHVRRTANTVAHSLAQFVCFSQIPFVWKIGSLPFWLEELVTKDSITD
ncbi:hypothetical protein DH2020_045906 [Rehmannia glutinosa]|uniref:Reverse transcriptase domain-containing protein n=1 Tax=Rehmannia glutinosa TaxID=99300 RepID=A0ABR0UCU0_REHGL